MRNRNIEANQKQQRKQLRTTATTKKLEPQRVSTLSSSFLYDSDKNSAKLLSLSLFLTEILTPETTKKTKWFGQQRQSYAEISIYITSMKSGTKKRSRAVDLSKRRVQIWQLTRVKKSEKTKAKTHGWWWRTSRLGF